MTINNEKKILVALDIDCTLLSTININIKNEKDKILKQLLFSNLDVIDVFEKTENIVEYTFARPNLKLFIERLNKFANIVIFTARKEKFALLAKEQIDPFNLYIQDVYNIKNTSCLNILYPGPKDLQCLLVGYPERKLENIVIIDDLWDTNGFLQLTNFIPIISWNVENINYDTSYLNILKNDNYLLNEILPFLYTLKDVSDVRPIIAKYLNNTIFKRKLNNTLIKMNEYILYYNRVLKNNLNIIHLDRKNALIEAYKNIIKKNRINNDKKYKIKNRKIEKELENKEKELENKEKELELEIENEIRHLIPNYRDTLNLIKFNLELVNKYNQNQNNKLNPNINYIEYII